MELIERYDGKGVRPKSNIDYAELIVNFIVDANLHINGYDCNELRVDPTFSCSQCPLGYSLNEVGCGVNTLNIVAKELKRKMEIYREAQERISHD